MRHSQTVTRPPATAERNTPTNILANSLMVWVGNRSSLLLDPHPDDPQALRLKDVAVAGCVGWHAKRPWMEWMVCFRSVLYLLYVANLEANRMLTTVSFLLYVYSTAPGPPRDRRVRPSVCHVGIMVCNRS